MGFECIDIYLSLFLLYLAVLFCFSFLVGSISNDIKMHNLIKQSKKPRNLNNVWKYQTETIQNLNQSKTKIVQMSKKKLT